MTEVFKFAYPREIFDRAPEQHRLGYLLLGQLWNDSILLTRQLITARTKPPEGRSDEDTHGQIASEFLNLRFLGARLSEGAELLKELGTFLPSWKQDLPEDAVAAVKKIRRYFDKKQAPLRLLRNKLGFHQDVELARQSLDGIADSELVDYRGQFFATTLFMSAEVLHLRALALLLEIDSSKEALNVVAEDVMTLLSEFHCVCQGYHGWFMATHVLPEFGLDHGEVLSLANAPLIEDVVTPFFANFDTMKERVVARTDGRAEG